MRLDSVEIKTTIAGAQVDRALEAFGFAPKGQRLENNISEDVTRGV